MCQFEYITDVDGDVSTFKDITECVHLPSINSVSPYSERHTLVEDLSETSCRYFRWNRLNASSILFGNAQMIWRCRSISSLLIVKPTAAALAAAEPLVYICPGTATQVTEEPEPCEIKKGLFSVHTSTPTILKASQSLRSKRSMLMSAALFAVFIITLC